jgi:hypothetical protein
MITRVNVCMCEFVCVCQIVLLFKKTEKNRKKLCFGEPKTRKSDSGFLALLHFFGILSFRLMTRQHCLDFVVMTCRLNSREC